ncbi:MAG: hypothetical protein ABUL60_30470 [Myxococcales bacterium]
MLKNKVGPLVLLLGLASCVCACSGNDKAAGTGGASATAGASPSSGGSATDGGGASATGGTTVAGGASAAGSPATTGGTSSTGGDSGMGGTGGMSTGGTSGTGGSTLTLAEACQKNCTLAAGLDTCSTTAEVCVQSCLTTFDNTSKVNADLGRQYTEMMVCVATNPKFATPADFVCAKPERALNKWSAGPDSDCEQLICDWNCTDGTTGNIDPFVDIRCACSSV